MTSWVYLDCREEDGNHVYTVGFYDPAGKWHPETDWDTADEAAMRVHYLNGGPLVPEEREVAPEYEEDDPDRIPF